MRFFFTAPRTVPAMIAPTRAGQKVTGVKKYSRIATGQTRRARVPTTVSKVPGGGRTGAGYDGTIA